MKCILILDAEGRNPQFQPPHPVTRAAAFHAYDVPRTITNPAGFVGPDHPLAWVHCFPQSGLSIDSKTGAARRGRDGPVLAEPFDDECRAAVAKYLVGWGRARGMNPTQARAALDKLVTASKALQLKNNPPPAAIAPIAAPDIPQ